MKKQILFLLWLLCLIPFNLIGQESRKKAVKLKPEQMTGGKTKGLNGNVRTITSDNGNSVTITRTDTDVMTTTDDPIDAFLNGSNFISPKNGEFRASAPSAVTLGGMFRINYTMEAEKIRIFRVPSFGTFEVLMGPAKSISISTDKRNGSVITKSFITYTYTLLAQKEGNFTVSGAIAESKGKVYTSNSVTIKVTPY